MYKVHINERPLILCKTTEISEILKTYQGKKILRSRYMGRIKVLLHHVDMMEKGQNYDIVVIETSDFGVLKSNFKSLFKIVEASGGVVQNEFGEILFIYRRGYWDLPKGKLDNGETKKCAAIREVEEETGVKNIELGKKVLVTKHMFRTRSGKRAIKKSHWYKMSAHKQKLIPQLEEDILKAEWLSIEEALAKPEAMYRSIEDVINAYVESNITTT